MSIAKTMTVAAALALVACNPESTVEDSTGILPADQAGPPGAGGLELRILGALIPGQTIEIQVAGAQPNGNIVLARGTGYNPGNFCPAVLSGLCVDMDNPTILATLPTNANGQASRTVTVPASIPVGGTVYFQAAKAGSASTSATSNVVAKFNLLNPGDPNRTYDRLMYEEGTVNQQAGSYNGVRGLQFIADTNGLSLCNIEIEATSTGLGNYQPCTQCDFAFSVDYANGRELPGSGDCQDTLAFNPATDIPPFTEGIGYSRLYTIPNYGDYETGFIYSTANYAWTPFVISATPVMYDMATGDLGWARFLNETNVY